MRTVCVEAALMEQQTIMHDHHSDTSEMSELAEKGTIEIRHVSKTFVGRDGSESSALNDISILVQPSEFVLLLGPSGCGKSTLLNMIAGFDHPTTGTILLDGLPIYRPDARRTMVFQNVQGSLFPWLTVRENVEFGLKMSGTPKPVRRALSDKYLRLVGLADASKKMPFELSGGMKQRCQIARAIATDPEILLMDEPFAAIDAQSRSALQGEIERIWKQTGKTIVFVTHDIQESVRLADRVIIFSGGPGAHILNVINVEIPRPRALSSPAVIELAQEIESLIEPSLDRRS